MGKKAEQPSLLSIAAVFLISGTAALLLDVGFAFYYTTVPIFIPVLLFATCFVVLIFLRPGKKTCTWIIVIYSVLFFTVLSLFAVWLRFKRTSVYRDIDDGKALAFGNRKALVIVPHEDDEVAIMSGVFEELLSYGSEVWVVFTTNGDSGGTWVGYERINEALSVADFYGIPAEHVVFLGYGDYIPGHGTHLYNAYDGSILSSEAGNTATYGIDGHSAFRNGNLYTRENFKSDITELILSLRPDIIFACDCDEHPDHIAASMMFEEALGKILSKNSGYHPIVLKGFSYCTSYYAEDDFYELNAKSTLNPSEGDALSQRRDYIWSSRIRLPVSPSSLSRSFLTANAHTAMKIYASQKAAEQASGMINGDKVFWERDTRSLSYPAALSSSSGDASLLNDFKFVDDLDLSKNSRDFSNGVWIPTDTEKYAVMHFARPVDISRILLYDNPSEESNILDAELIFNDGTAVLTGPLNTSGTATFVNICKKEISEITVNYTAIELPVHLSR